MPTHLIHGLSGHMVHTPGGHLSVGCGTPVGDCECLDLLNACAYCPGDTPTQFHVTFTGVTLCPDCVNCADGGPSAKIDAGSSIDGTYLMTHNGSCAWVTQASDVPCTLTFHGGPDCTGVAVPLEIGIEQTRLDAHTFRLQITDNANNILLFTATVTLDACCAGYTASNQSPMCGCSGSPTVFYMATGGSATVTPC